MAKKTYHAYEIYTAGCVYLGANTDAAELLLRMAEDLREADGDGGVNRIILGQVKGKDLDDALKSIRAAKWLAKGFADAQCH
jgi:hypothetical protein